MTKKVRNMFVEAYIFDYVVVFLRASKCVQQMVAHYSSL